MRHLAALGLALLLLADPARAGCEAGEAVILVHHSAPATGTPKAEVLADFARRADQALQGRACVQVQTIPGGDAPRQLAELVAGQAQLAVLPVGQFDRITRRVRVYDLPFLFPDLAAVEAFQASPTGRSILADIDRAGLRVLGHWHNGMAQLAARRPLLAPGDAAGLTFGAEASPVLAAQFASLGAKARALGLTETGAALAAGQLDGQSALWSDLARDKSAALNTDVTQANHRVRDDLMVASGTWWTRLDGQTRAILTRLLVEATHDHNRLSLEREDLARAQLIRNGGTVRDLTPAQRAAWVAAMAPVWRQFEAEIGAPVIAAALEASTP